MNTPGSSFRSHSLNSRIARLASTKMSISMLKNAGIIKNDKKNESNESSQKQGFKQIEDYLIKKRTISKISNSMVIEGTLIDRDDDGITVRIHTVYNLDTNTTSCTQTTFDNLDPSLNIIAICLYDEIENNKSKTNNDKKQKKLYVKQFPIGSKVKGVVIKVDYHTLEIYITTLQTHSPHSHFHKLGLSHTKSSSNNINNTDIQTNNNMRYSPYYSHKRSSKGSISPFQFKPTLSRSSSSNSTTKINDDQKINNYNNNYYVPSKVPNSIAPSPLYAAVQEQEQIKYQGHIHQLNMNEFDLLQNKFEENYNNHNDNNDNDDDNNHNHNHNGSTFYSNKISPNSSVNNNNNANNTLMDHASASSEKNKKLWIDRVRNHELFRNPAGVDMMRNAFGIDDYSSLMYRKVNICKDWLYIEKHKDLIENEDDLKNNDIEKKVIKFDKKYLREEQAYLAARYALRSGIDLAKAKNLEKAIKHYNVALEWDNKYCDAMVAKGAALCHLGKLNEAEISIRNALKLNPNTPNADKYLAIILQQKAGK